MQNRDLAQAIGVWIFVVGKGTKKVEGGALVQAKAQRKWKLDTWCRQRHGERLAICCLKWRAQVGGQADGTN